MTFDLPVIFTILMGVAILAYVILDGYDLGVGILLPFATRDEQDRMVASIGPFWDANETWLVLGVGLLLVAFPAAHGLILGALYLPVALMLIALMLRGVAFEFRVKAEGWHRELWNRIFFIGSFLATLSQGVMVGALVTGFRGDGAYWIFNSFVAFGLTGGYALLGATWLIMKTEGALQAKALRLARQALFIVAAGVAAVSIATPLVSQTVFAKWFDYPRTLGLLVLPLVTLAAGWEVWRSVGRLQQDTSTGEWRPFAAAATIFLCAFLGLAYSLFPWIVIDRLTIWQAASHPSALKVILAGALVVLPFIIAYTVFAYRVFWGKAKELTYG
jgi:cytochrome d ubiquinol oxidase subunit II